MVWEAFKSVKRSGGGPGVDGQTMDKMIPIQDYALIGSNYVKSIEELGLSLEEEGPSDELTWWGATLITTYWLRSLTLTCREDIGADAELWNLVTGDPIGTSADAEDIADGLDNILVVAETDRVVVGEEQTTSQTRTVDYACAGGEGECAYPLLGVPPYTITNLHPELYELRFVAEDGAETLIASTMEFDVPGNLKAKQVSQQVVFNVKTDGDGEWTDSGFYGCQAASFIDDLGVLENEPLCSIKGGKFCSPQEGKLINSWSGESLIEWGYVPAESEDNESGSFESDTSG